MVQRTTRKKVKVPLYGQMAGRVATIEDGATRGATIGSDLFFDDGSIVTIAALQELLAGDTTTSRALPLARTLWRLIQEVPIYTTGTTSPTWEYTLDGVAVGNVGFAAAANGVAAGSVAGDLVLAPIAGRVYVPQVGAGPGIVIDSDGTNSPTLRFERDSTGTVGTIGVAGAADGIATGALAGDLVLAPTAGRVFIPTTIELQSTAPRILLDESDAAADRRLVDLLYDGATLSLRTRTDLDGAGSTFFRMLRGSGTAVSSVHVGVPSSWGMFAQLASSQWLGTNFSSLISSSGLINSLTRAGSQAGISVSNTAGTDGTRCYIDVIVDGGANGISLMTLPATTTTSYLTNGPATGAYNFLTTGAGPFALGIANTEYARFTTTFNHWRVPNYFAPGSVGAPGISFLTTVAGAAPVADSDTGLYWIGADSLGIATAGALRAMFSAAEIELNATLFDLNGSIDLSGDFFSVGDFEVYCGVGAAHVQINDVSGAITIVAGNPAAGSTGDGATLALVAGLGGFTSGYGGTAQLRGGDSSGVNPAGLAQILGGKSYGSAGGGDVGFTGGESVSGSGGSGFFYGGTGTGHDGDLYFGSHAGTNTALKITGDTLRSRFFFAVEFADGSAAAPSISFGSDTNTGLYWISADRLGIATAGALRVDIAAAAIALAATEIVLTSNGIEALRATSAGRVKFAAGLAPGSDAWEFANSTARGAGNGYLYAQNPSANVVQFYFYDGTTTDIGVLEIRPILAIPDGLYTAPATIAGFAQIYVDSADGDLKVKFGDGTVKTIVTD